MGIAALFKNSGLVTVLRIDPTFQSTASSLRGGIHRESEQVLIGRREHTSNSCFGSQSPTTEKTIKGIRNDAPTLFGRKENPHPAGRLA